MVAVGEALLARVLPASHAAMFAVEAISCDPASGNEALEYEAAAGEAAAGDQGQVAGAQITLRGCTGVAVASALNWYLKSELKTYEAASWSSLPPIRGLPDKLPLPAAKQRMVRPVRFSWVSPLIHFSFIPLIYFLSHLSPLFHPCFSLFSRFAGDDGSFLTDCLCAYSTPMSARLLIPSRGGTGRGGRRRST